MADLDLSTLGAPIKVAYEGEADTNAFDDAAVAKLAGIELLATADQSDAEIETAYNTQVGQVSAGEKTAGTETAVRRFSPLDIADMAGTHGGGGGGGGGMTVTPVKIANYTASVNEVVPVDSTAGPFTITLPAAPSAQERVIIIDVGKACSEFNVTVARNGKTIDGAAEDFIIDQDNGRVDASYDGTSDWDTHLIGTPNLINSPSALLGSATVSGAAATSITISGLDLSAHAGFRVIIRAKNATGSNGVLALYYNGDVTGTNYYRQLITANGGTITGGRSNDATFADLMASARYAGEIMIASDPDGYPRATATNGQNQTTLVRWEASSHYWTTAANVTSITITSSVASSLDVGSTVEVYAVEQGGGPNYGDPARKYAGVNDQTGTAYELLSSDAGKLITMNNASANTLTIPANSSIAFEIGTRLDVMQLGAGTTTIAITTDTLNGNLNTGDQYEVVSLIKIAATTWVVVGGVP